VTSVALDDSH